MEKMTVAQLLAVAKQKGIDVPTKAKKSDIMKLLEDAPKPVSKVGMSYPGEN